jgi:hypothetical protein
LNRDLTPSSDCIADGVDLHYLDKTNFKGYDGQDYVTIGDYTVESRLGLLTQVAKDDVMDMKDSELNVVFLLSVQHPSLFKCGWNLGFWMDRSEELCIAAQNAHISEQARLGHNSAS